MTAQKIYLNGHIDVPQDRRAATAEALPTHIELTRAERGCLSFEVIADKDVEGRYLVSEVFLDQAAFDARQQRMKTSHWFTITQGISRDYTIHKSE